MERTTAVLALLVLGAEVGLACSWQRNWCPPPPAVYVPCPPPIVVAPAPAPAPVGPDAKPAVRDEVNPIALYERAVRSCVYIVIPRPEGFGEGMGALIDAEKRLVVTTYRAVADAEQVFAQFPVRQKDGTLLTDKKRYLERIPAGQALKGKVIHHDKTRDLALVQLDHLPKDTSAVRLAANSASVGDRVFRVGNAGPGTQAFARDFGMVRAVGLEDFRVVVGDEILRVKVQAVTTTVPAAPGDTGEPVIDDHGQLVAISEGLGARHLAEAASRGIDVTEIRAFVSEKSYRLPKLGLRPRPVVVPVPAAVSTGAAGPLDGDWKMTEMVYKRTAQGPDILGTTVRIANGKLLIRWAGGKHTTERTLTVRTNRTPGEIDSTTAEVAGTSPGIYELKDGTLRIIFAPRGADRPTGFDATTDERLTLYVLRKAKN
jgi:uncharacterized protein (TIGR03067 family)